MSVKEAEISGPHILGLDIGTTTICAAVTDLTGKDIRAVYTRQNKYTIPTDNGREHMQDPAGIFSEVKRLIGHITKRFADIRAIGIAGQMHGILFTDSGGTALSPLYTWQDERAGVGAPSACEIIREKTGYKVPHGYGVATYYSELLSGNAPEGAAAICTVMDYIAMRLCGSSAPVTHASNAASLGLYSLEDNSFDMTALEKLGISADILPDVTADEKIIGYCNGIPVAVAIGDNQADFLGTVSDPRHTALANFGTGSQISLLSDSPVCDLQTPDIEARPFIEGKYIISGSALCGGRAYAVMERFFRRYAASCGSADKPQYEIMNRLAADGIKSGGYLPVKTSFCGLRSDPGARGVISGISEENFTPEALLAGTLYGMAEELYGMYRLMPHGNITSLIASGNAVRLNPALSAALEDVFKMKVTVTDRAESAAAGAALFAAKACKKQGEQ